LSKEDVTLYSCDRCCTRYKDPINLRKVVGNVEVPDQGGLIGQNIFYGGVEKREEGIGKIPTHSSLDNSLRLYEMDLCIKCFLDICGITEDGHNKLCSQNSL